jgi:hypothetical protein
MPDVLTAGEVGRLTALSGNAATDDRIPIYDTSLKQLRYATPDQIASGASAVDGPASATDNAVARFDGTTGKLIQNSAVTIADTTGAIASGNITTTGTGGSVFNSTSVDSDFTVKKNTSGNAIAFDAGTVDLQLNATTIGLTGAITHTGAVSQSGTTTYSVATSTTVLKQGANGKTGTFTLNGATPVSVSNTSVTANSGIIITLKTVGGTVSPSAPNIQTITASTGFTVAGTAGDTSVYNYHIIESAA